jgi:hypothetical protein
MKMALLERRGPVMPGLQDAAALPARTTLNLGSAFSGGAAAKRAPRPNNLRRHAILRCASWVAVDRTK